MVKFGIIGCGHIGRRHAEMVVRNAEAELVALCDVRPREELGIEAYDVPFYLHYREMFKEHPEMDVVNICVPNGLHARLAIAAMEAGFNVVIEKPVALTQADALCIAETERRTRKTAFCVLQNRYSPPSLWLKELVDSGRLGPVWLVQMNCYWNRDERYYTPGNWHGTAELDGGTLFTQFSHFIDIMVWLFGDIENVTGRFNDFSHQALTSFEDSGLVQFDFKRGGVGSLNYSTAAYDKNVESSITILARNGSVKIGGQYMDRVEFCHVKDYVMPVLPPTNPGNDYGAYKGSAQNHHYVIQNVVDTLAHGGRPHCGIEEQVRLIGVIEKIYAARGEWRA